MNQINSFVPLVEATRAGLVESVHFGAFAIVDINGNLRGSCGDPHYITFMRSSSKPLQAIPLIELGGKEKFQLTDQEIALTCASHEGTDLHIQVLKNIQEKTGIQEEDLLCGTHPLKDKATSEAMLLRGEKLSSNRHNCSGKHTGFLATAVMVNESKDEYILLKHPVQQAVLQTFSEMCQISIQDIHIGIDGCSVPVFALPLNKAAQGIARLCEPVDLAKKRADACRIITRAMSGFPEMVAGPNEFDTKLMQIGNGKVITKRGAEGYQIIGLLPGACGENSPGLGIAIKISDGDPKERARPLVSLEILRQLGVLDEEQLLLFPEFYTHTIKNWRKLDVGELRPCFQIDFSSGIMAGN